MILKQSHPITLCGGMGFCWDIKKKHEEAGLLVSPDGNVRLGTADGQYARITVGVPDRTRSAPATKAGLANLKSLQKKAADEQLAQAYDIAVEIVRPLAGLSKEEQLEGIKNALRAMFDSGMDYSTTAEHYDDPYGYLVLGAASCVGCTRATGLCLNIR